MSKFQLLECHVALAGDILNVVHRHMHNPITFPELLVLQYIHGETAITDIFAAGEVNREESAEYQRLVETYGAVLIRERLFPGAGTRLPLGDSKYKPRIRGTKINPGALPGIPDLPTLDELEAVSAIDPDGPPVPRTPRQQHEDEETGSATSRGRRR
jgi:hypothetical protein